MLRALVVFPIRVYRRLLSPMKGAPSCRFVPTCSEYALESIESRGVFVGLALTLSRLLRCNPLFHGGYHPVGGSCPRSIPGCIVKTPPVHEAPRRRGGITTSGWER
jgi:putative membrane protein insertion efficiency factor